MTKLQVDDFEMFPGFVAGTLNLARRFHLFVLCN